MPLRFARIGKRPLSKATFPVICPSCRFQNVSRSVQDGIKEPSLPQAQAYSQGPEFQLPVSKASIYAISAKKEIPPQLQDLHSSLSALQNDAISYINLSQLRLALRGLESKRPITRIAVLGIHGQKGPRRLVRALLADPLNPELEWERQLLESEDGDGRGVLIRYSEHPDFDERYPLFRTLSIPSSALRTHNLEIFIQSLPPNLKTFSEGQHSFLVPSVDALVDDSGPSSTVVYPVHKTLIYASNLQNISTLLRNLNPVTQDDTTEKHIFRGIVDGPWENLKQEQDVGLDLNPINLARAEDAILSFRNSLKLAMKYEHSWFGSGLADVSNWVFAGMVAQPPLPQPTLQRLIEVISKNSMEALSQDEDSLALQRRTFSSTAASMKKILSQRLVTWAESAHRDLCDQLGIAFIGKNWKKLAWWKLFWRIDDVTFITSDILRQDWLVQAEKTMIWLSGQISQASHVGALRSSSKAIPMGGDEVEKVTESPGYGSLPPPPLASDIVAETYLRVIANSSPIDNFAFPWPQNISRARSFLSRTTIPPLQALCQRLLFQTISTTVLTSSLSTLLYISISTTSIYEAGAIAAIGFVYSMQRLQKKWSLAINVWEANVREEGRRVLREIEEKMRMMLLEEEEEEGDPDSFRDRDRLVARRAIELVKEELSKLNGSEEANNRHECGDEQNL